MPTTADNEKNSKSSNIADSGASSAVEDESPSTPFETEMTREPTFEPIRAQKSETGTRPGSMKEMSRTRSQNGYGCDDDQEQEDIERAGGDKDEFEVTWENGDLDPLNPRSLGLAKKWSIVIIVSMASLCV